MSIIFVFSTFGFADYFKHELPLHNFSSKISLDYFKGSFSGVKVSDVDDFLIYYYSQNHYEQIISKFYNSKILLYKNYSEQSLFILAEVMFQSFRNLKSLNIYKHILKKSQSKELISLSKLRIAILKERLNYPEFQVEGAYKFSYKTIEDQNLKYETKLRYFDFKMRSMNIPYKNIEFEQFNIYEKRITSKFVKEMKRFLDIKLSYLKSHTDQSLSLIQKIPTESLQVFPALQDISRQIILKKFKRLFDSGDSDGLQHLLSKTGIKFLDQADLEKIYKLMLKLELNKISRFVKQTIQPRIG